MKDLTQVNGLKVESRESATMDAPGGDGSKLVVKSVDVLLLEDGRIIYQCVHKNDANCEYTAENVKSVTAHQRKHGDAKIAREALATAAALERELAERVARRSEGSKRGALTRRKAGTVATPAEVSQTRGLHIGDEELAKMGQKVITAYNALRTAEDEFQNVLIGYMRAAQVATERPAFDPVIAAKAKKWDAYLEFQNLINEK